MKKIYVGTCDRGTLPCGDSAEIHMIRRLERMCKDQINALLEHERNGQLSPQTVKILSEWVR